MMHTTKEFGRLILSAGTGMASLVRAAAAGITGAALTVKNFQKKLKHKTEGNKKTAEVIQMKKSTIISLFVALAAVAGVLGALYVYVLRREKELDEYEQLLFSEDFSDDIDEDDLDAILAVSDSEE